MVSPTLFLPGKSTLEYFLVAAVHEGWLKSLIQPEETSPLLHFTFTLERNTTHLVVLPGEPGGEAQGLLTHKLVYMTEVTQQQQS